MRDEPAYFKFYIKNNIVNEVDIYTSFLKEKNLSKSLVSIENMCSLSSNNNSFAYMMALEKIANINLPIRAEYLRVIVDEVVRVSSHLFNLGMLSHMVKSHIHMSYTMDIRELVQEFKEIIWGSKIDCSVLVLGGVKHDINRDKIVNILEIIKKLEPKIEKLIDIYENDKTIRDATVGIGVLSNEDAIKFGTTGPVARASGINNDVRINSPYSIYKELNPVVVLGKNGDVHSRIMVRCYEIKESLRMIKEALIVLPEGKIVLENRPLIHRGEAVSRVEAPRGELLCYLKTHSEKEFSTIRWRAPTYMNWEVLKIILPKNDISNIALITNSIDPCLSCL